MDVAEILVRAAWYSSPYVLIPTLATIGFAALTPAPDPFVARTSQPWLLYAIWLITGLPFLASVVFYLYVHLVQQKTIPQYVEEHSNLRRIRQAVGEGFEKILNVFDAALTFTGKLLGGIVFIAIVLIVLAVVGVVIYYLFGALSAPWWAIVIIILLIMIWLK